MSQIKISIAELEQKIKRLVERNKELESINNELEEEHKTLLETIREQKKLISQLEDKNKILKITKTLELDKDPINAKFKINEMLREIDKCIALLDK